MDYGVYVNSTFKIEKEIFFDSIWNPKSSFFQKYGRRYLRRIEMFDYKMKSQNETITTFEYKGTISKYHSSMDLFVIIGGHTLD